MKRKVKDGERVRIIEELNFWGFKEVVLTHEKGKGRLGGTESNQPEQSCLEMYPPSQLDSDGLICHH